MARIRKNKSKGKKKSKIHLQKPKKKCQKYKIQQYARKIKNYLPLLEYISKLPEKDYIQVVPKLKPVIFCLLRDIALNFLSPKGLLHAELSLCEDLDALKILSAKPSPKLNVKKRELLVQKGSGFIAPLLGIAVPALIEIVSKALGK
jgi:hypothetical protein